MLDSLESQISNDFISNILPVMELPTDKVLGSLFTREQESPVWKVGSVILGLARWPGQDSQATDAVQP